MLDVKYFIMLDVSETINGIEVGKSYPNVQIIRASDKTRYPDLEAISRSFNDKGKLDEGKSYRR